ncbi:hypothetical protein [Kamptonema formosum]|uniref:hypothetical protein n=1 Tax=Kamptonema formosum TaxID=331992 RepID=UPI0012DF18CE|nr:hypothetical protein [Oscillatoria sp. PCC 10802]
MKCLKSPVGALPAFLPLSDWHRPAAPSIRPARSKLAPLRDAGAGATLVIASLNSSGPTEKSQQLLRPSSAPLSQASRAPAHYAGKTHRP